MSEAATPEVRAASLGWTPKETFKGDPAKWVDAEEFLRRGEEIMPILRENNRRLQQQLDTQAGELSEAKQAIAESQEAMQALIAHQTEATKAAVKDTKARLRGQLRAAREANDFDAIEQIEDQLDEVRDTERKLEAAPPPKKVDAPAPPTQPKLDPEFIAWQRDNPWYGSDKRRTAQMHTEAMLLRDDPANNGLKGRAFYERAAAEADAILNPKATHSKVETGTGTGTPSTSSSTSGSKTFASLPAEAKEACRTLGKSLIGPNRAFKDEAAWQKHYVEQYYAYGE